MKRILTVLLAVLLICSMFALPVSAANTPIVTRDIGSNYYTTSGNNVRTLIIKQFNNQKYLNVWTSGAPANGSNVTTYSSTNDPSQRWALYRDSVGVVTLRVASNLLLGVSRTSTGNCALLTLGNDSQLNRVRLSDAMEWNWQGLAYGWYIKLFNNSPVMNITGTKEGQDPNAYNVNWDTADSSINQCWNVDLA